MPLLMRVFNTEGPNDPKLHYTVIREGLLNTGMEKVMQGKYFTIFAPRQSGKTTYFKLLMVKLTKKSSIVPIWITAESLFNYPTDIFYQRLHKDIMHEIAAKNIKFKFPVFRFIEDFHSFFEKFLTENGKRLCLIIDEFDGMPEHSIKDFMHKFRQMYHKKDAHALHSVILVGVKNITEVNLDNASPFNITDEVSIPYFSPEEVRGLIKQHVDETGQRFDEEVIEEIIFNTGGQPGLVNAVCRELVENQVTERTDTVKIKNFRVVLELS